MKLKIISTLLGLSLAGFVFAQQEGEETERPQRQDGEERAERGPREGGRGFGRMSPLMVALDKDRDGEISAEEIEAAVASLKTLDANKDGKLAGEEIQPPRRRGGPEGEAGERGPRGPRGGGPRPPREDAEEDNDSDDDSAGE